MIPVEIPTKKAKSEIETHPVTTETKIRERSIQFFVQYTLLCFLFINSF